MTPRQEIRDLRVALGVKERALAKLEDRHAETLAILSDVRYRARSARKQRVYKGKQKSIRHNARMTAEAEQRKTDEARWLVQFQISVDQKEPCHPHHDANSLVGWSSVDFIKCLKDNKSFLKQYSLILMPPPPPKARNGAWVNSLDASLHAQKDGKPGAITMLIKMMDERFQPKRAGRPAEEAAKANGSVPSDTEKLDQAMASMFG